MSIITWRRNAPLCPDHTRAAEIRSAHVIGYKDGRPVYEAVARCDDFKERTFISGPDGAWILKEQV